MANAFRILALITVILLTVFSLDHVFERRKNPNSYGRFYANYSETLENIDHRISYRWFAPTVAHYLGFRGGKTWVDFTMFFYVFGSVCLFYLAYRITKDTGLTFVVSLIPTSTVAAHFSKWLPGYPDWIILGLPFLTFLSRDKLLFAFCCAVCIWSHERAFFIWMFIPFFRQIVFFGFKDLAALFRNAAKKLKVLSLNPVVYWNFYQQRREKYKMLISDCKIVVLTSVSYLFLRDLISPAETLHTFKFYMAETIHGSIYAQEQNGPTAWLFLRCYLEALKSLWIPFFCSLAVIVWKKKGDGWLEVGLYIACCCFVGLQLFIAIDSVRLLDFLNFPLVIAIIRALSLLHVRWQKRVLISFVIAAILVNHHLPVTYIDVNGEFLIWKAGLDTPWVNSP